VSDQPAQHGYWRSLAELVDAPELRTRRDEQFPDAGQPYLTTEGAGGMHRRRWMQLMGASVALAGAVGCRWERDEILPFDRRPVGRVPGQRQQYATTMDLAGDPLGLTVTCFDGRPIKIEGNRLHPSSLGATHPFAQAAILELYDPDRSRYIIQRVNGSDQIRTNDEFAAFSRKHFDRLREGGGQGLVVLAEASSSPTLAAMRARLKEGFPQAKWCTFEPLRGLGQLAPHYRLDKAEVIVCLDADLLGLHAQSVRLAREFANGRNVVDGRMNRLYAVESCMTITGGAADHRQALRSSQMPAFVASLQRAIDRAAETANEALPVEPLERFIAVLARDLVEHRGRALVAVGAMHPPAVQEAVAAINRGLEAVGQTVDYFDAADDDAIELAELVGDLGGGRVDTLLILGGNPAYAAPADLQLPSALASAKTSIHLGLYRNETARLCTWHVPQSHFLESWGDARTDDGAYSVVQPMIEPLHGGRSAIELLGAVLGDERVSVRELVRAQFKALFGEADHERAWRRTLHDGVVAERKVAALEKAELPASGELAAEPLVAWDGAAVEVVFRADSGVLDGRFANNGWLQEFPDPISRMTWDNAAWLCPSTAERLGVQSGGLVKLKADERELTIPAWIVPGMAEGTLAVALGYGRTAAGQVGGSERQQVATVGVNAYALRTSAQPWLMTGVAVEPLGDEYPLASVQDHFAIDTVGYEAVAQRLPVLVREANLSEYLEHPDFAQHMVHHPPRESLWTEPTYEGHRWAMTVDLSRCTGCGACVVACQAENNVPVVGKERVLQRREMHWLRIDRYFSGEPASPGVAFEPILCQHCELAPCEGVCPVNATVHSSEGLNDMVYNRCVGTRYCGNNCPYKVRRFNYFNYHKEYEDPANEVRKMGNNPDVTIRSRGVMEKCTYCVQRIQAAKIDAKNARRPICDGEIMTACQQACPAGAIIFGDLGPEGSEARTAVAQSFAGPRSYEILQELNHKTRTRYLAKIRNPNPALVERQAAHDDKHDKHNSDNHEDKPAAG
jgi:molybdopterin-containing oxidoreductase family iron-sulfur binding subunit